MGREIYEEFLGPDAAQVFQQAADRKRALMSPEELEAVEIFAHRPRDLTEDHKTSLCGLLSAVSDGFASRRRSAILRQRLLASSSGEEDYGEGGAEEEAELWIPDEDGKRAGPMKKTQPDGDPSDGELRAFLDGLDEG